MDIGCRGCFCGHGILRNTLRCQGEVRENGADANHLG